MIYFAKDEKLKNKENSIINLVYSEDIYGHILFNKVREYFETDFELQKSSVLPIFNAIYIEKLNMPAWKLAIKCNVSRSCLFNYRNSIIECFLLIMKKLENEKAVAVTEE